MGGGFTNRLRHEAMSIKVSICIGIATHFTVPLHDLNSDSTRLDSSTRATRQLFDLVNHTALVANYDSTPIRPLFDSQIRLQFRLNDMTTKRLSLSREL